MQHHRRKFLLGIATLALAACSGSSTSVTQIWSASGPRPAPVRSVIVLVRHLDEANRRVLEETTVDELSRHAVTAKPSYELFPGELPDRDRAREVVGQQGFDAVLVADVKRVHEETEYIPGTYSRGFWSMYGTPYWHGSPGYLRVEQIASIETTLWDLRGNDRLVWAAHTRTTNPSSPDFAKSMATTVVPKLRKAGLIPGVAND